MFYNVGKLVKKVNSIKEVSLEIFFLSKVFYLSDQLFP